MSKGIILFCLLVASNAYWLYAYTPSKICSQCDRCYGVSMRTADMKQTIEHLLTLARPRLLGKSAEEAKVILKEVCSCSARADELLCCELRAKLDTAGVVREFAIDR